MWSNHPRSSVGSQTYDNVQAQEPSHREGKWEVRWNRPGSDLGPRRANQIEYNCESTTSEKRVFDL